MSRRGRALGFLAAALLAAVAAAAIADGYGSRVAHGYGELRQVVVAAEDLRVGRAIDPGAVARALEVRRVPARFVPPGALVAVSEAVGLVPVATVPAGSYLLASQLRPPRSDGVGPDLAPGRRPVEIAVSGASALTIAGGQPLGAKVDIVVTSEPSASGRARTYIAAAGVPLLALAAGSGSTEPGGTVAATLGLTREQALRLIDAQSFARRVTIVPGG